MNNNCESLISFQSKDGFQLEGTVRISKGPVKLAVLFVHGITVDREEDGFYTQFAKKCDTLFATSLRFDLRGHGASQGKNVDLTLAGVTADIDSAVNEIRKRVPRHIPLVIIAASFGGGLTSNWAFNNPNEIRALVLLNPLLDYGNHMLFSKWFWEHDHISPKGNEMLKIHGWLPHGEFKMGPELIDELSDNQSFEKVQCPASVPVLTIHGNKDSIVSFETAQNYFDSMENAVFVTLDGSDHGFVHPKDENFLHPDTIHFRSIVFEKVITWIRDNI